MDKERVKEIINKLKAVNKKKIFVYCVALICTFAVSISACVAEFQKNSRVKEAVVVTEEKPVTKEVTPKIPEEKTGKSKMEVKVEKRKPAKALPEKEDETKKEDSAETQTEISDNVILLAVPDKGGLRTDVVMMLVFNHKDKKINLISIPRDTKVTYGSKTCKLNAVAIKGKSVDMDILKSEVTELTGICIDSYLFIDIEAVKNTVDLFGGVTFNVPVRMVYEDPYQNLYINLHPGKQLINGGEAEQLLRFRKYTMGDLKRTEVQRNFLKEAFSQHAKVENLWKISEWYNMVKGHIKTDVSLDGFVSLSKTVFDGGYTVDSYLMPCSTSNSYVICNSAEMKKLAASLGY